MADSKMLEEFVAGMSKETINDPKWVEKYVADDCDAEWNTTPRICPPKTREGYETVTKAFFADPAESAVHNNVVVTHLGGNNYEIRFEFQTVIAGQTGPGILGHYAVQTTDGRMSKFRATCDFGAHQNWVDSVMAAADAKMIEEFVTGMSKESVQDMAWFEKYCDADMDAEWNTSPRVTPDKNLNGYASVTKTFFADPISSAGHDNVVVTHLGKNNFQARFMWWGVINGKRQEPGTPGHYQIQTKGGKISKFEATCDFGLWQNWVKEVTAA